MLSAAGDILEEGVLEALSRRHWVNFQTSRTYLKSLPKDKELTKWSGMLSKLMYIFNNERLCNFADTFVTFLYSLV
jgi:hypothetical protein